MSAVLLGASWRQRVSVDIRFYVEGCDLVNSCIGSVMKATAQ